MSRPISRVVRRGAIHGWIWYLPALAVVIGVLGFDTYLNVETRRNDYEVGQLRSQARVLEEQLIKLRTQRAEREHVRRLSEHAKVMGLREAAPGEIVHIAASFVEPTQNDLQRRRATPEPSLPPASDVEVAAPPEPPGSDAPETLTVSISGADPETMAQLGKRREGEGEAQSPGLVLTEMPDPLDESMDELLGTL